MAPAPLLAACLIVRDEQATIRECLSGLASLVDEIVVYDTGSVDDTVAIARAAGATVIEGGWQSDFAAARNAALVAATATWVLCVDADERLSCDPDLLRERLRSAARIDAFSVIIDQAPSPESENGYRSRQVKLFRRGRFQWSGRVHEQVVALDPGACAVDVLEPAALVFEHTGYSDVAVRREKSRRNARLGLLELQELSAVAAAAPDELARVLLDLGRSLIGCDQQQDAAETLAAVRGLTTGSRWLQATELLCALALGSGKDADALTLVAQLRSAAAGADYCDWLEAQALAQLGEPARALALLNGVRRLVDSAGRDYGVGQLIEMRALVASLAGEADQAVAALIEAMAAHGRIANRGGLLLSWWGDRPVGDLWAALASFGPTHLAAIRVELEQVGAAQAA